MKRAQIGLLVLVLMLGVCSLALAQEQPQQAATDEEMPRSPQPMMGKGPMMHEGMKAGMKPMCPMQGMMMKKEMVAASDGGVIVMVGNKLMKYDKDLDLKKEVELKIDAEAMHQMMGKCPMCQKMREECKQKMAAQGTEEAAAQAAPAMNP
jgi:hypothetical protein